MKKTFKALCLCASIAALGLFGLTGCGSDEFANADTTTPDDYRTYIASATYDVTSYKATLEMGGISFSLLWTENSTKDASKDVTTTVYEAYMTAETPEMNFYGTTYYAQSASYYLTYTAYTGADVNEETQVSGGYIYAYQDGKTTREALTSVADAYAFSSISSSLLDFTTITEVLPEQEYDEEDETKEVTDYSGYTIKKISSETETKYQVSCSYTDSEDETEKVNLVLTLAFDENNNLTSYTLSTTTTTSYSSSTGTMSLSKTTESVSVPSFVSNYTEPTA